MLFALDWIERTWNTVTGAIRSVVEGVTLASATAAITGSLFILIPCALLALVLCGYGFRRHKLVSGIVGGVLLGVLGWHIGSSINPEQISVSVVYMLLFGVPGFFVLYLLYPVTVFAGSFLLSYAALSPLEGALAGNAVWIALALAVGCCILYVKFKLVMSALSGALVLGLMAAALSPIAGVAAAAAFLGGGIPLQLYFRRRYYDRLDREYREQCKKYPYGPGQIYGWPEPKYTASRR